jgi:hypothetical protein
MTSTLRALTTAALAAVVLGGCNGLTDALSPGRPSEQAPARLALAVTVPRLQTTAPEDPLQLSLSVRSAYERADGSFQPLDSTAVVLGSGETLQVPVSIELGRCLADDQRRAATTDPTACFLRLTIALTRQGRVLDEQVLTNVRTAPGTATAVPQAIQLSEVASVFVSIAPGTTPAPSLDTLTVGSSVAFLANPRDATGNVVPNRVATWSSSNASVMTVTSGGTVNALAPGTATITATVGGRAASIDFLVIPPPQRLTVVGVPGTGTGRVQSSPAGIDCTITSGVPSGTCAFDFPAGSSVQLAASAPAGSALFSGWTGACLTAGTSPTCSLTLSEARTVGAGFTGLTLVNVAPSTIGGVVVTSTSTVGISCTLSSGGSSGTCGATFPTGSTLVLTALEPGTARVRSWTGCDTSTRTTCTLQLAGTPRTVSLTIDPPTVLSVAPVGSGSGVITSPPAVGSSAGLTCGQPSSLGTQCTSPYPIGTSVVVTATPQSGSRFDRWVDGPCDGSTVATCAVTFAGESTIALFARFEPSVAPITLNLSGSGGGRVFIDGALACELSAQQTSTQCVVNRPLGASLDFTGAPLTTGQFLTFGGDCNQGTACMLVLAGPLTISASFTSTPPSAAVVVGPAAAQPGSGFVGSSDEEILCNIAGSAATGTCVMFRPVGTQVTLYAQDFEVSGFVVDVFRRWSANSPCPNSPEPECTFTLGASGAEALVTYGPGVQIDIFIDAFSFDPFIAVGVSTANFRALPVCDYAQLSGPGRSCRFPVPRSVPVTIQASTNSNNALELSDFPFCSWSGSSTAASCTFALTGSVSGEIFAFSTLALAAHPSPWSPSTPQVGGWGPRRALVGGIE